MTPYPTSEQAEDRVKALAAHLRARTPLVALERVYGATSLDLGHAASDDLESYIASKQAVERELAADREAAEIIRRASKVMLPLVHQVEAAEFLLALMAACCQRAMVAEMNYPMLDRAMQRHHAAAQTAEGEAARLANFQAMLFALRADEGDTVTLLCDNPDFNGQPSNAIECNGGWTAWQDRRFTGDSLHAAVLAAFEARSLFTPAGREGGVS